jgi:GNAT superfamily N-acetyltransferase
MNHAGERPRRAVETDLGALREIVDAAYGKYLIRMDRPPGPMLRDMQPLVEAEQVWVVGRPITGLISLVVTDDDSLLVENVAVHPDAQGAGLGRQLMEFAEEEARRLDARRLWLYTNEVMHENIDIYAHLGYREFDRRNEGGYRRVFMEKIPPDFCDGSG